VAGLSKPKMHLDPRRLKALGLGFIPWNLSSAVISWFQSLGFHKCDLYRYEAVPGVQPAGGAVCKLNVVDP
jgi:hypothetical protein